MISVTNSDKGSFTMKFSTRDRYALRLMVELANRPNDLIPLKDISDKQRISLKYLEQIVTPLAKAGRLPACAPGRGDHLRRDSARRRGRADGHPVFGVVGGLPPPQPVPHAGLLVRAE